MIYHMQDSGIHQTQELLSRNYWWPGMMNYVKKYIKSCDRCLRKKMIPRKPQGFLNTIPTEDQPWETITMDFIVQLPKSHGYDAIWVVADHTLKEAHFVPTTSDVDTKTTVNLFINYVWKLHGLPKKIISD